MKKREIIKKLLLLQIECMQREEKFRSVDLDIEIMGDLELWDIALDLIGFPEEKDPPEGLFEGMSFSSKEELEQVIKNMSNDEFFCRDWLYDHPFMEKQEVGLVDNYIDWLFNELRKLNLEDPATIEASKLSKEQLN